MQWHRTHCTGAAAVGMPLAWSLFDDKKLQLGLQIISHASVFLRIVSSTAVQSSGTAGGVLRVVNLGGVMDAFCKCASAVQTLSRSAYPSGTQSNTTGDGLDLGVQWLRSPSAVQANNAYFPQSVGAGKTNVFGNSVTTGGNMSSYVISNSANTSSAAQGGVQRYTTSSPYTSSISSTGGRQTVTEQLIRISESLICATHSLCALSGSFGADSISGVGVGVRGDVQKVLSVADAFPSHSFIRQVARWLRDMQQ